MKILEARTLAQWRMWLAEHHDSQAEVWLVFHKRHTGKPSVAYGDALDEALCFGWIDSLIKRLDADRYARKFTPRKADSRWSAINRQRYARLEASGRLMASGRERAPTDRDYDRPRRSHDKVPSYIKAALRKHSRARHYFEELAPSHRRHYVGWIDAAKLPQTKRRRLREAIRLLAQGKKLGLK